MKKLILALMFSFSISAQAYLLQGLNIDGYVFAARNQNVRMMKLELCLNEPCSKADETVTCLKIKDEHWSCHADNIPAQFRFVLTFNKKIQTSPFYKFDDSARRFAVHFANNKLDILNVSNNLFFRINMQEMLENVFDPVMVEQIRKVDTQQGLKSSTPHPGKSKIALKECENENCETGRNEEVICTLHSKGIAELGIVCERKEFARFGQLALYGRDKNRVSPYFLLNEMTSVNLTQDPVLQMVP